jgi:acyl-[acyl-carrier-protein]-phospholipid O-acyltransferase/long-chain-fatty-acid--[acyl-carrier-protein] ligase
LLIIPDYTTLLSISESESSLMSAGMAVAIGVGCIAAAWISGDRPKPILVPIGAGALALFFVLLGLAPRSPWLVGSLLAGMGLVAGLYIIPLQSMLQALAPDNERGRFLGTANAMSFVMGGVGSLLFVGVKNLGIDSDRTFLLLAVLTVIVGALLARWLFLRREALTAATLRGP